MHRIGIDLSIVDRSGTGTGVYAENLYQALGKCRNGNFEFIELRAPKPIARKNLFTKLGNFAYEVIWLTILLPLRARQNHLDLVHMPANIISPILRIPQVCSIHDAHFITNPKGRNRLWIQYARLSFRYAARRARLILCDSNSAKREVVKLLGANPDKIKVIYLGLTIRQSNSADDHAVANTKPYILSVGATDPNKNFPSLLKAFYILMKAGRIAEYRLVIAGPHGRDYERLRNQIRETGLSDHIELTGRISDSRLAALYKNASFFVFPSFCEGFGFPPLEAMYYGIPVVASKAPCIPEVLGGAALYFDPHNISEIAERMESILNNPELRKQLIQAGKKRALDFTWEETSRNTLAAYQSILGLEKS